MFNVSSSQSSGAPTPKASTPQAGAEAPQSAQTGQRLGASDRLKLSSPAKEHEAVVAEAAKSPLERLHDLIGSWFSKSDPVSKGPNGEVRVSEEVPYHTDTSQHQAKTQYERFTEEWRDKIEAARQSHRQDIAPGVMLKRSSDGGKYGIRQLRADSPFENQIPIEGLKKTSQGWSVPTVANPEGPDAPFDPFAFMPNVVFAASEDSFPTRPDLDGDGKTETDADAYKHGVIGGRQPLTAGFSVAKKGEYVVMTYSYYYVDNKFTNYHRSDSSTVSVYLKPDKNGHLKPEYLYNSWHYGGNMTRWEDLKKGPDGRPVVLVERGSHAMHPFGQKEDLPAKGLWINGDGSTAVNGQKVDNRLTLLTPQANVANATPLHLDKASDLLAMNTYYAAYPERTHPIHPILFKKLGGLK